MFYIRHKLRVRRRTGSRELVAQVRQVRHLYPLSGSWSWRSVLPGEAPTAQPCQTSTTTYATVSQ